MKHIEDITINRLNISISIYAEYTATSAIAIDIKNLQPCAGIEEDEIISGHYYDIAEIRKQIIRDNNNRKG